ncbi:hypothetical protein LC040_12030 [Bacillus tianshenii]|nr:hypothetical protein LC040_12030 [Bacillus tianshenii]
MPEQKYQVSIVFFKDWNGEEGDIYIAYLGFEHKPSIEELVEHAVKCITHDWVGNGGYVCSMFLDYKEINVLPEFKPLN